MARRVSYWRDNAERVEGKPFVVVPVLNDFRIEVQEGDAPRCTPSCPDSSIIKVVQAHFGWAGVKGCRAEPVETAVDWLNRLVGEGQIGQDQNGLWVYPNPKPIPTMELVEGLQLEANGQRARADLLEDELAKARKDLEDLRATRPGTYEEGYRTGAPKSTRRWNWRSTTASARSMRPTRR